MKYIEKDLIQIGNQLNLLFPDACSVLITGATGLIGSTILKAILVNNQKRENNKIIVLAMARSEKKVLETYKLYFNSILEAESLGVKFVFQDICSPIITDVKSDYIIHTANATVSKFFMTNPVDVIDSIYTGSKMILEYAMAVNSKGVVYLSSMEVFGQVNNQNRISESELGYLDIQNVRSCYSESKRLVECMCKCYAEQYGLNVKVARLAQTFGAGILPSENRVFAQFARSAINGQDIVLHTTGESMGNYCYLSDAVNAILLLLVKGESGQAYSVVNENMTMQIKDMAKLVIENFSNNKSKLVFDIPETNVYGYATQTQMRLSSKKLRDIGWAPTVDMIEAYQRMISDLLVGENNG